MAKRPGRDRSRRGGDRRGDFDASGEWYDDDDRYTGEDDAYASRHGGALMPVGDESGALPVPYGEGDTGPFIIPGSGETMGTGYIPRRERPLVQRLAVITLTACIIFTGLFAVAPLNGGGADARSATPFEALAGAVVWHAQTAFVWYTAKSGDTLDSIATKFGVQIGGIYELNGMLSGQEIEIGKAYKIPTDPSYGLYYRPTSFYAAGNCAGCTRYGNSPWTSIAGNPPAGSLCGPTPHGDGDNMGNYDLSSFNLYAPNPNAYWVRGFSWYHNGADLANPEGTPIHASQAGEVIFAGWDPGGGGWTVKIDHCNHLSTFYAHNDQLLVHAHQMVNAGDVISLEGSTGWSTGPHCHFTVEWDNNPVDPLAFFDWSTYNITHRLAPA